MRVRRESQIIPWFLAWPADEVERLLIEIRNKAEISWREILKVHLGHVGTLRTDKKRCSAVSGKYHLRFKRMVQCQDRDWGNVFEGNKLREMR